MKILHCCLAAFYIDNYGYQENILPKMHKLQGHIVSIVASRETYLNNAELGYVSARSYLNENNIPVTRLNYANWLPFKFMCKIRSYIGLKEVIYNFRPDIIFLHDIQFFDVYVIVNYKKNNPNVKIYADGHTDYINSAKNWVSRNILHKILYRYFAKKLEPSVEKFFGVTPLRVEFFHDVYRITRSKLDLLVLGLDDSVISISDRVNISKKTRQELGISKNDFVIICGGKIDRRKNIHLLLDAFVTLGKRLKSKSLKLILFGIPTEKMKYLLNGIKKNENIIYVEWLNPEEITHHLLASDLACFPGTHSVLWEQAVGLGIPSLFKRWDGMEHVNVGGNCRFLESSNKDELVNSLYEIITNKEIYQSMQLIAQSKGVEEFSYFKIAKKAIGLD